LARSRPPKGPPARSGARASEAAIQAALAAALAHQRAGRADAAAAGYEAVLRRLPRRFDALHMLAVIEAERGRPARAMALFRAAVAAAPRHAEALRNFGGFLQTQGQLDEAIALYRRALDAKPDFATAQSALAIALRLKGDLGAAEAACREAIRLNPRQTVAYMTLAGLLKDRGRVGEAIECYRRALECDPNQARARALLYHQLRQIGAWDELPALEAALDRDTAAALAAGRCPGEPVFIAVSRRIDPAYALAVATGWSADVARRCPPLPPAAPAAGGRIRLGYLSADLHDHATGHLIRGLFAGHDRDAFEVYAYSYGPDDGSFYRKSLVESCDRFVDIERLDHGAAAERIRADGVELLIDLKGHVQGTRLEIAALRPAPVQVAWLGFPGSLGAPFIDYAMVDAVVAPPEQARFFSERLVYLPDSYQVTDDAQPIAAVRPSRAEAGLADEGPVLASFNQSYKLDAETFAVWMRVLAAAPSAQLWLLAGNAELEGNLRATAARAGVDPGRLRFAGRRPKHEHLARLGLADLSLDTRIYNGHTTTTDSLWAGVPVLTMLGGHFASRVSASLLGAIGLPELATADLAAYERTAIELACDPTRLAALRAKLAANRATMPLFDTARFVRGLERAYARMSELSRAGRPPEPIDLRSA
jgi:protein O-GlcNAc transferase